ncbi:MAG: hypothetical protein ACJ72M_09810 [Propionibacteriaceae bacterium]
MIAIKHNVMISTPKTAKVGVPSRSTAALSPRLREHRKRQAAERLLMGAGWTDNDLVFWAIPMAPCCTLRGSPVASWSRWLPGDGCQDRTAPHIRLHDLRHRWATMAPQAGVHPKVMQERLGRANIGVTLDTYSHVVAGFVRGCGRASSSAVSDVG